MKKDKNKKGELASYPIGDPVTYPTQEEQVLELVQPQDTIKNDEPKTS